MPRRPASALGRLEQARRRRWAVASLHGASLLAAAALCARHVLAFAGCALPSLHPEAVWHHRAVALPLCARRGEACAPADTGGAPSAERLTTPVCVYEEYLVRTSKPGPPAQDITVENLTPKINAVVQSSGVREGTVTVVSRHTTTAITINEWESRLVDDIRAWLLKLAPPDDRSEVPTTEGGVAYLHNDIDERPDSSDERQRCRENGWDIDDMDGPRGLAAWRAQEPINAHSHLLSMALGSSESIPVHGGKLVLGQWQSVMLVDLDGPRDRTVGLQVTGFK